MVNKARRNEYALGVDPGFTGALAFLNLSTKKIDGVFDMPLLGEGKRRKLNPAELTFLLDLFSTKFVVLEKVWSMPGEGVSSSFKFGNGFGLLQGIFAAQGLTVFTPSAPVWKSALGLTRDKKASLEKARSLFPAQNESLRRVKDHGRAEAMLLAHFGADRLN